MRGMAISTAPWRGREADSGLGRTAATRCHVRAGWRSWSPKRVAKDSALARMLRKGGVDFAFQPIRSLASGDVQAYEVLVRPRGATGPAELVAQLARAGLLDALGDLGLHRGCAMLSDLSGAVARDVAVHVNVSALQLADVRFAERARRIVASFGIETRLVIFEVTEDGPIDHASISEAVSALRAEGFGLALDDFGSRCANIDVLGWLEPDFVKLDRCVVELARKAPSVLHAVVSIARELGAMPIAEGIEDSTDREAALTAGCPLGQGWALGRPQPRPVLAGAPGVA